MKFLRHFVTIAAVVGACVALAGAPCAQTYPNRPVKLVVPFPAGTGTDLTARLMAQYLQIALGQTFVVENKPGAGGSIGAMEVVRAAPDGYTLLFASNSATASNVALLKSIPYDPARDLTLIAGVGEGALVLMVRADHPARSLDEFIEFARQRPSKLNGGYGSSSSQISIAMLNKLAGIDTVLVPYKGIPLAITDVFGGSIDFTFVDTNNAIAQAKGGKLRALAVTSPKRSSVTPDWPTLSERVPAFNVTAWFALLGPARLPVEIVDRLNVAMNQLLGQSEVRSKLAASGIEPFVLERQRLAGFIPAEVAKWVRMAKDANIEPE